MTAILGISAYYHDSAAAVLVDGRIVAAAQEERFTRKKHDASFPHEAVAYCLRESGISAAELDYVAYYEKPFTKAERLLETHLGYAPTSLAAFLRAAPTWIRTKLRIPAALTRELGVVPQNRYVFTEHHESHAASAFFPSPFEESAILTLDAVGEWATGSWGVGRGNRLELTHEMKFPHSLGLLYAAFTYHAGFKVNSGEYKLMGLAPYGTPRYAARILEHVVDLKQDGSFRLDMSYFGYGHGLTMTSKKFHALFDGPPRAPESALTEREMDLAASIQQVTEEIMVRTARHVRAVTGLANLCMAGGVALNCVGNGRIIRDGAFENVFIQPASGDAGAALGVATFVWHQLLGNHRSVSGISDGQSGSLLGPHFDSAEVARRLDALGATFTRIEDDAALCDAVATDLEAQKVVGWFHGRMEFGPRALGARSILGDARNPAMQSLMNRKIKFRESFRPFAASVLEAEAQAWFSLPEGCSSPYMLVVAEVLERHRRPTSPVGGPKALSHPRSTVPAVTHVDYSVRLQTVDAVRSPRFHALITRFAERTGCPMLINTSFNVRGEPIVCSPEDAYRCFMATDIDVLVIENLMLRKEDQPAGARIDPSRHLGSFEPD